MTLPWKTCTRSLLPSTTRTWTLTSSPGANAGMSSRSDSLSMRSVAFMAALVRGSRARRGWSRIRDRWELFQQRPLLGGQPAAGVDEVRPRRHRPVEHLRPAPAGDASVVTTAQDLGHRPAPEVRRPGVLGLLQQALRAEALGDRADVVAHHAGQEPGHR